MLSNHHYHYRSAFNPSFCSNTITFVSEMDELVSKLASFVRRSGGDHVSPSRQTMLQAGRPENRSSFLDEGEHIWVISGLRRDANNVCALPGSYAV